MIGYSDDIQDLRSAVSLLFAREAAPDALRALWDSETGRSPALWKGLVDIGVTGLLIDAEDSGGDEEMYVVLEEVGRYCVPDALLEGIYLAGPAIAHSRSRDITEPWVSRLVQGSARATVLLAGSPYVADAHLADVMVFERDGEFHLLTKDEFIATPVAVMDRSRRLSSVVPHASEATNLQLESDQIELLRQRALLGSAAQLNGVAQAMLQRTIDYVKQREQFGRKIGSFQAVKHLIADAFGAVTLARMTGWAAAGDVASRSSSAMEACLAARIVATEAEKQTNDIALQCHGGIGFTWEHDLQMWLKRGKALEFAYGSSDDASRILGAATM